MRLDPAEVHELPLPAALLDTRREVVAATPEWQGRTPGGVTYYAGHGFLSVGSGSATDPDLQTVLHDLLAELDATTGALEGVAALQSTLLSGGLRLVAGEPIPPSGKGTSSVVLQLTRIGIAARVDPPLAVEAVDHSPALEVPDAPAVALALVQLAVNVARHEHAGAAGARPVEAITIRAQAGPTFQVEWDSDELHPAPVRTHRHVRQRERWGLGYVRMAADMVGGVALPPAPSGPGRRSVSFGLGARNLTLPLALLEAGRLTRRTRAWDQEHRTTTPEDRTSHEALLDELTADARALPGQIATAAFHTARAVKGTDRLWLAMPPEVGDDRVLDVLRGIDHERLLLSAPEPHATRLHALNVTLRRGLGEPLATTYASEWRTRFARAARGLGIRPRPPLADAPVFPDPQLTAWLVAEFGGEVALDAGGAAWFRPGRPADDARLRLLGAGAGESVRLTAGMP